MNIPWVHSKWSASELNERSIEFQLSLEGRLFRGIGQLLVRQNPEGEIAVEIVSEEQGSTSHERLQRRFIVPGAAVERIEFHPDSLIASFRLYCS